MAYPASDFWYHLLSGSDTLLGAVASGHLELTPVPSTSSNWQLLPFDGVYFIKNEAFGPLYQLGASLHSPELSLVAINLSSTEQQWELKPVMGDSVRIYNVALGDVNLSNATREWSSCDRVEVWKVQPVKLIDASLWKNTQLSFLPAIRSVPNETSAGDHPLVEAPYYIPIGPAAAGIALGIALIFAVVLWRFSPARRKRTQEQPPIELNCVVADGSPAADAEPLPQYRPREADDHPPGYNTEQPQAPTPPAYPMPVVQREL
ncbi:hypothetical protein L207DRAFT_585093 [Hyaloscypha variabilis F]|uniref:Uncharacterized protein n=1 Tax=Hyaloscypha variabilis (strain UAMH 11265 / GT02V1 / F) TaxID=1149755 RepID=A0A2J6RI56_HYAVF|nr:hypothetical protein L207DRAFT_585093 [Hyaloscypha variabilis F]